MFAKTLQRPTLVLNRNWQPVHVATVARALVLLWNEAARVVDPDDFQLYDWADWAKLRPRDGEDFIQAVRFRLRVPEVIALGNYDRLPNPGYVRGYISSYARYLELDTAHLSNLEAPMDFNAAVLAFLQEPA